MLIKNISAMGKKYTEEWMIISTDYRDNQAELKHSNWKIWKIMVNACPCWNRWKGKSEATFAMTAVELGVFGIFYVGIISMGEEI